MSAVLHLKPVCDCIDKGSKQAEHDNTIYRSRHQVREIHIHKESYPCFHRECQVLDEELNEEKEREGVRE